MCIPTIRELPYMTDFLKIAKSIVVYFAHICAYGVETVKASSSSNFSETISPLHLLLEKWFPLQGEQAHSLKLFVFENSKLNPNQIHSFFFFCFLKICICSQPEMLVS